MTCFSYNEDSSDFIFSHAAHALVGHCRQAAIASGVLLLSGVPLSATIMSIHLSAQALMFSSLLIVAMV